MTCAHVAGIFNAHILHGSHDMRTDKCAWYSISFTFDTTLGVYFGYALFSLSGHLASKSSKPICTALTKSGQYTKEDGKIDYAIWGAQMAVWCAITFMSRMLVLCTLLLIHTQAEEVAALISQRWACDPDQLLVLVMIGCPVGMNIMQLWIQDQFLKAKDVKLPEAHRQSDVYLAAEIDRRTPDPMVRSTLRESLLGVEQQQDTPLEDMVGQATDKKQQAKKKKPPKREVKAYRKLQKKFCNACLLVFSVFFIATPVVYYGVELSGDQDTFDHCYSQVRNDDPEVVKAIAKYWKGSPSVSSHSFFKKYPDDVTQNPTHKRFHNFSKDYPKCDAESTKKQDDLKHQVNVNRLTIRVNENTRLPLCMCCSHRSPRRWSGEPSAKNKTVANWTCGEDDQGECAHLGECCKRSSLQTPNTELKRQCAVCTVYNPCDQERCAARPAMIRNAQHTGLVIGLVLSFFGNGYIVYTYFFDESLRTATITRLLVWVAALQILFCVTVLFQEATFRLPNQPCTDPNHNCQMVSTSVAWPSWEHVAKSYYGSRVDKPTTPDMTTPGQRGFAINWCQPVSFIVQLTFTASDFYYLMIAVDLLLNLYALPFGDTEVRMFFFHGITWSVSLVLAIMLIISGDWGVSHDSVLEDFCWNVNFGRPGRPQDHNSNWPWFQHMVYYFSIGGYLISAAIAGVAQWKIKDLSVGQREARGPEINQGTAVVFVSALWLICWAAFYNFVIIGNDTLGFAGYTQDIVKSLNVFPDRTLDKDDMLPAQFPIDYEKPIHGWIVSFWSFMVGARNLMNYFIFRFIVLPKLYKQYAENRVDKEFPGLGGSSGGKKSTKGEERPLKKVLQNELLFFTGLGIRGALREVEQTDWVSGTQASIDDERNISLQAANDYERQEKTDFFGSFTQIFAPGEDTIRQMGAETLRNTRDETVVRESLTVLQKADRDRHLTQYKFRTYRPKEFRKLRELFNIDTHGKDGADGLLHKAMEAHQEGSFTGGASGSFMYFSGDKRFIVKQITHGEMVVLLEILPYYIEHMEKSKDLDPESPTYQQCKSLLLRIVQCNRIKMYHSTNRCIGKCLQGRVYFMVFENLFWSRLDPEQAQKHALEMKQQIFPHGRRTTAASASVSGAPLASSSMSMLGTSVEPEPEASASQAKASRATVSVVRTKSVRSIYGSTAGSMADNIAAMEKQMDKEHPLEVYDLKGSWVNRSTVPQGDGRKKGTMKDNDLHEKLYLKRPERDALIKTIRSDTQFLRGFNIMDYSLLLGIEKGVNDQEYPESENNSQVLHARFANSASKYYVGIIDILQKWNFWKRAERLAKALMGKDLDGVSSTEPEEYRKRFAEEMANHIYKEPAHGQFVQQNGVAVPASSSSSISSSSTTRTEPTLPPPRRPSAAVGGVGSIQAPAPSSISSSSSSVGSIKAGGE